MEEEEYTILKRPRKNPPPRVKNIDGSVTTNQRPNRKDAQEPNAFNKQIPAEKSLENRFSNMSEQVLGANINV